MQTKIKTGVAVVYLLAASACSSLIENAGMHQRGPTNSAFKSSLQEESPIYEPTFGDEFGVSIGDNRIPNNMRDKFHSYSYQHLYSDEEGGIIAKARENFLESLLEIDRKVFLNLKRFFKKIGDELNNPSPKKYSKSDDFLCSNCKSSEVNLLHMPNFFVDVKEFFDEKDIRNYSKYCTCINQVNYYRTIDTQQLINVPLFMLVNADFFGKINGVHSLQSIDFSHEIYKNCKEEVLMTAIVYGLCSLITDRFTKKEKISNKAIDNMLGLGFSVLRSIVEYKDELLKSFILYITTTPFDDLSKHDATTLEQIISSKKAAHPIYSNLSKGICSLPEAHIMCEVFRGEGEIEVITGFCETFLPTKDQELVRFHKLVSSYQKAPKSTRESIIDLVKKKGLPHSLSAVLFRITHESLLSSVKKIILYNRSFLNEERLSKILKLKAEWAIMFINLMDMEKFTSVVDSLTGDYIKILNEGTDHGVESFLKSGMPIEKWNEELLQTECFKEKVRKSIFSSRTKVIEENSNIPEARTRRERISPFRENSRESQRNSSRERKNKESTITIKTAKKVDSRLERRPSGPRIGINRDNANTSNDISYDDYVRVHRVGGNNFYFPEVEMNRSRSKDRFIMNERRNINTPPVSIIQSQLATERGYTVKYPTISNSGMRTLPLETKPSVPSLINPYIVNTGFGSNPYPTKYNHSVAEQEYKSHSRRVADTATSRKVEPIYRRSRSPIRITYSPLKNEIPWPYDMNQDDIDKIKRLPCANHILCALAPKYHIQIFFIDLRNCDYHKLEYDLKSFDPHDRSRGAIAHFMHELKKTNLNFRETQSSQNFYRR